MLPGLPGGEVDHDEETRVVFVGATRTRVRLLVGNGYRQYVRSVASGRAYSPKTGKGGARAQVEIGRDGDIDPAGLAGRHLYPDADHVRAVQRSLADLPVGIVSATAVAEPALHFTYRVIQNQTSARLGFLSQRVNSDLFEVGDELRASVGGGKRRPPDQLPYLRIFGLRTVAVAPEAPVLEQLHEPWSRTGFLLAPLIVGYTMAYFPFAR